MSSRKYYICKPFFDRDSLQCSDDDLDINIEPTFEEQYADVIEMFQDNNDNETDCIFDYLFYDIEVENLAIDYYNYFAKDPYYHTHMRTLDIISLEKTWFELTKIVGSNQLFIFSTPFNYLGLELSYLLEDFDELNKFNLTPVPLQKNEAEHLYYHLREHTNKDEFGYCILKHDNPETLYAIKDYLTEILINNISILYENEETINGRKNGLISLEHISKLQRFDADTPLEFIDLACSYFHQKNLNKKLTLSNKDNDQNSVLQKKKKV